MRYTAHSVEIFNARSVEYHRCSCWDWNLCIVYETFKYRKIAISPECLSRLLLSKMYLFESCDLWQTGNAGTRNTSWMRGFSYEQSPKKPLKFFSIVTPPCLFQFPLKLTRSFISSGPGTYIPSPVPSDLPPTDPLSNLPKIKPFELVTYLKVGNTQPWQIEPTPFTLEFVADLLPGTKMGELKIRFEYGHVHPVHNR